MKKTDFERYLATLTDNTQNKRHAGDRFERVTQHFLQKEPRYAAIYKKVWLWKDWAKDHENDATDIGADLIAERFDGGLCAIQCKFFNKKNVSFEDISTFLALLGQDRFSEGLIVTTATLSKNLENALKGNKKVAKPIDKSSFENSKLDWAAAAKSGEFKLRAHKKLRPYQEEALEKTLKGFKKSARGQLIMACGTGKTLTALKIAENTAGAGKLVAVLVPSLALLSQTLREWTAESETPIMPFAVCSDSTVGKASKKAKEEDTLEFIANELDFPTTTDAETLAGAIAKAQERRPNTMAVIFSTYQSSETLEKAQKDFAMPEINLVICDEAHRTAGAMKTDEMRDFSRILDQDHIRAEKRLFMTATPIIYSPTAKKKAETVSDVVVYSMDNEAHYGKPFHTISFDKAVRLGALCDYKLIILTISEEQVSKTLQKYMDKEGSGIPLNDAAKMVGCYRALTKADEDNPGKPMESAIAFAQVIDKAAGKASSKLFADNFAKVIEEYWVSETSNERKIPNVSVAADHVDGSMASSEREKKLDFLRGLGEQPKECRILSNVRCLSEGVDVPALDAIIFLSAKNSQVEITQAVGRVMRNAPGKKLGYVILPVVVPAGYSEYEYLNDSNIWRPVWQVVQALRSHDAGMDNHLSRLMFDDDFDSKIEIVGTRDIVFSDSAAPEKVEKVRSKTAQGRATIGKQDKKSRGQAELPFMRDEITAAIISKTVEKVGNRLYWPQWAERLGKVANTLKLRISNILASEDKDYAEAQAVFGELESSLKDNISDEIDRSAVLNILAAQAIAMPVFASLFQVGEHEFPDNNNVAQSLQKALDVFLGFMREERAILEGLYSAIQREIGANPGDKMRQSLIKDIYENTIKAIYGAEASNTVVYTPIEAVDFILRSVAELLKSEFNSSFEDKNIKMLEPFAGTGSFITRLLSGCALPGVGNRQGAALISPRHLPDFYKNRLWFNEINLLAYYACIANIETTYHSLTGTWENFENLTLADTFTLNKQQPELPLNDPMAANTQKKHQLQKAKINIIVGNPPYGYEKNISYADIDGRIKDSYAKGAKAMVSSLYDGYIRAFRFATDRIENKGIVAFITNGGFLDSAAAAGLRKHLTGDFSSLYIINLRGNLRTRGEQSQKEGGNIFAAGSRTPCAISILVKNPADAEKGKVFYYDVGDYKNRIEKLDILAENTITTLPLERLTLDKYGDWLNKRGAGFVDFMPLIKKKDKKTEGIFAYSAGGVCTHRDAWVYNVSPRKLGDITGRMISFYNYCAQQRVVTYNNKRIHWTKGLERDCEKGKKAIYDKSAIVPVLYRPFTRSCLYYSYCFNGELNKIQNVFPNIGGKCAENRVVIIDNTWRAAGAFIFCSNVLPDLHILGTSQCFPLYLYNEDGSNKRSAISAAGLEYFRSAYPGKEISAEDIFYYIYALLSSPVYREKYKNNLMKELPRIPLVKAYKDFVAYSAAGRALAALHLNFDDFGGKSAEELAARVKVKLRQSGEDYTIQRMKFGGKIGKRDKSLIHYNGAITLEKIPLKAYKYMLNGQSAIEMVMDRQRPRIDKVSGIVNNPAELPQAIADPAYSLKLLLNVIWISLETLKIQERLSCADYI